MVWPSVLLRAREAQSQPNPGSRLTVLVSAVGTQTERLAAMIDAADSVVALTGAGISVPSGIPDFRTPGTGLWANVDPMEVAHIDVFRRDPERFWQFYGDPADYAIIGLLPSYLERKTSSLVHMAKVLMDKSSQPDCGFYLHEFDRLHDVLQRLEQAQQPSEPVILDLMPLDVDG